MDAIALRLKPRQDLRAELDAWALRQSVEAACVITCVGSLNTAVLRLANQTESTFYQGYFEIVSLTGILSQYGSHYHICIADSTGRTVGGHLLTGCQIYTTAELVLGLLPHYRFRRALDAETGYAELAIDSF
jgi:uncharacterized protein